jgi:GNAT superfamily N-acetyltransferase
MTGLELLTAADIPLMQDLAQRVTAIRPDLISAGASYGELAWVWGQGCTPYGGTWPRRLWFSGDELVAWGWAFLPRQVRRNDGSVRDVTGAALSYQVHPGHLELTDEVIRWYDQVADPVLPAGYQFRTADQTGPEAAVRAHLDAWTPSGYTVEFEPVGTHPDHRRLGLARAMLLHGMHLARAAGAAHATVVCKGAPGHPQARGPYYGLGFREISRDIPLIKAGTAG